MNLHSNENVQNVAFTANGGGKNDNNFAKNDKADKDFKNGKGKNFTAENKEKSDKNFIKEKRKQYKKEAKEGSKAAKKTNENFGNGKNVKDGKTRVSFFENENGKTDNRTQSKSKFSHGSYAGDKGAKPARLGKKNNSNKEGK